MNVLLALTACYVETATFDIGMSQYQQVTTDKTDWTRQRGATGSSATGPSQDVTPNAPFGNGKGCYRRVAGVDAEGFPNL